jgi:uncharacterized protein
MIKKLRNHSESVRFITDHNLGKLAKWLRLLGYDTLCYEGKTDKDLWNRALQEKRVVLTRKKNLQYFPAEVETMIMEMEGIEAQLSEVLDKLPMKPQEEVLFKICTNCNSTLRQVDKSEVSDLVPPYILKIQDQFYLCSVCSKVYWCGSHVAHIKRTLMMHNLMDRP